MDCSPLGSSIHGILQARLLVQVTISFSGDLPNPGIEPGSPALQADSLLSEPQGKPFPWIRPCYLPLTDPYNYIGSTQRIQDILHLKMFNVIILRKFLCAMWKWMWRWKVKSLSHVRLFATPWTVAHKAPPSMGFSKQEYWSVLPFPSPGDLPDPGIEPRSPTMQVDTLTSEPSGKPPSPYPHKAAPPSFNIWVFSWQSFPVI